MCYDQNRKLTNRERIIGMIGCNNIETFNRWKEIEIMKDIENKVKRIQFKAIENIDDVRYTHYVDEFDYLVSSGIVLGANAISEPKFPLIQSSSKNLIKLYMNDIGLLTNLLYKVKKKLSNNIDNLIITNYL